MDIKACIYWLKSLSGLVVVCFYFDNVIKIMDYFQNLHLNFDPQMLTLWIHMLHFLSNIFLFCQAEKNLKSPQHFDSRCVTMRMICFTGI